MPQEVESCQDKLIHNKSIDLEKRWREGEIEAHPVDWGVEEMSCAPNRVAFSLDLYELGAENFLAKLLWILCSSDGKDIFEACISLKAWFWFLGFDGNFWVKEIEREIDIFTP